MSMFITKELGKMADTSEDAWIAERAKLALKFKEELDNGILNEWEFKDLMEDLIRTDQIKDSADKMKLKANIEKLITLAMNAI